MDPDWLARPGPGLAGSARDSRGNFERGELPVSHHTRLAEAPLIRLLSSIIVCSSMLLL